MSIADVRDFSEPSKIRVVSSEYWLILTSSLPIKNEGPFKRIKSFFKIYKEQQPGNITLCSILDDAIYKSNIFPNEPPFHKACLIIIYQFWENGFYTVCYSFCCNFVICIKESYRAPIFLCKMVLCSFLE